MATASLSPPGHGVSGPQLSSTSSMVVLVSNSLRAASAPSLPSVSPPSPGLSLREEDEKLTFLQKEFERLILAADAMLASLPVPVKNFTELLSVTEEIWTRAKEFVTLFGKVNQRVLKDGTLSDLEKHKNRFEKMARKSLLRFLRLQRQFWEGSRKGSLLKTDATYALFLSHAGEQKSHYGGWLDLEIKQPLEKLQREFSRRGHEKAVFFDENSLAAGDIPRDIMIYAASNCKLAVAVMSREYFCKPWPLIDLLIFGARLENQAEIMMLPRDHKLDITQVPDEHFALMPDFYDDEEKHHWIKKLGIDWFGVLSKLPSLLPELPTGIRLEDKLDKDHAGRVVEAVKLKYRLQLS